jgi:hypothetical protein
VSFADRWRLELVPVMQAITTSFDEHGVTPPIGDGGRG